MEKQQLKLGDKIKMKLVQPAIKCSGRDDVTCHYRGKVVQILPLLKVAHISFKMYGDEIKGMYDMENEVFLNDGLQDVKIQYPKVCCFD